MCKNFETVGCAYGSRCVFAHGDNEQRGPNDPLPALPPESSRRRRKKKPVVPVTTSTPTPTTPPPEPAPLPTTNASVIPTGTAPMAIPPFDQSIISQAQLNSTAQLLMNHNLLLASMQPQLSSTVPLMWVPVMSGRGTTSF
eukprot:Sspe_Gene.81355::Locus_52073_Transcript_1_1_Confidence_1.000_Length_1735::g.81355::m.81355